MSGSRIGPLVRRTMYLVGALLAVALLAAPTPQIVHDEPSWTPATVVGVPAIVPAVTAPSAPVMDGTVVMDASDPVHLRLPSIGVESDLMELGLMDDGSLEVPPTAYPAGWFTGAPTPGELGPAIVAGHVDYAKEVGVFHDLHRMEAGDKVFVERADGSTAVFTVTTVKQYAKNAFPTGDVYGDIDHAGLRLITCGGEFDWEAMSHRDNIVVFAELDLAVDTGDRSP